MRKARSVPTSRVALDVAVGLSGEVYGNGTGAVEASFSVRRKDGSTLAVVDG